MDAYDASTLTTVTLLASSMTPALCTWLTYRQSGVSQRRTLAVTALMLAWTAMMVPAVVLGWTTDLGVSRGDLSLVTLVVPVAIAVALSGWATVERLSQRWLVGLQLFRAIGFVFLVEMERGHVAPVFAYPAGIGDIMVATAAATVLIGTWRLDRIPTAALWFVAILGIADFVSAFFFGYTSSLGTLQVFTPDPPNQLYAYPTGLIPFFLVPFATSFHVLSIRQLLRDRADDVVSDAGASAARVARTSHAA
jgi:hypothetical protein